MVPWSMAITCRMGLVYHNRAWRSKNAPTSAATTVRSTSIVITWKLSGRMRSRSDGAGVETRATIRCAHATGAV
ncbi:hypothetical protein D3C84_1255980 [compost metagenome]